MKTDLNEHRMGALKRIPWIHFKIFKTNWTNFKSADEPDEQTRKCKRLVLCRKKTNEVLPVLPNQINSRECWKILFWPLIGMICGPIIIVNNFLSSWQIVGTLKGENVRMMQPHLNEQSNFYLSLLFLLFFKFGVHPPHLTLFNVHFPQQDVRTNAL